MIIRLDPGLELLITESQKENWKDDSGSRGPPIAHLKNLKKRIERIPLEGWGLPSKTRNLKKRIESEWVVVKRLYNYDEGILLQFAEGPKPDQLRVKATAILEVEPERRPSWLNLQILRATSDRVGFLETLRLISKDLESMMNLKKRIESYHLLWVSGMGVSCWNLKKRIESW